MAKQKKSSKNSTNNIIGQRYYTSLKYSAKRRGIEWSVDKEYLQQLFDEQKGICALTHLPIILVQSHGRDYHLQTASLDRRDNSKGYVKGNCRWVIKAANFLKGSSDDDELVLICRRIVTVYDYKNLILNLQ